MIIRLNRVFFPGMVFACLLLFNISAIAEGETYEDPIYVPPARSPLTVTATNAFRILFVGNSITRHGKAPEPYKWNHVSGMAASCEANDYVHLLVASIQKTMPGRKVEPYFDDVNKLRTRASSANPLTDKVYPRPDLVVIQTGEHEGPKIPTAEVSRIYEDFIVKPYIGLNPRPAILCVGVWYVTEGQPYSSWVQGINDAYRGVCKKYDIPFASVESLATDPTCRGWGEHPGVRWHPNDKGMKGYADLLFKAYQSIKDKNTGPAPVLKKGSKDEPTLIVADFTEQKLELPNLKLNQKYWVVSDNALKTVNSTEQMITFSFGEDDWQDYEVEFRIKRIKLNPKDQHFGLFVRCNGEDLSKTTSSLRLYSEGSRIALQEKVDNKQTRHCSLGPLPKPMGVGKSSPWVSFRIALNDRQAKVYMDNTLVGTVDDVLPTNGKIIFYAYNLDLWIDNLKVMVMGMSDSSLKASTPVRNILHNSSFEQRTLDRLPDYWGCNAWGIVDPYWVAHYEEWVKNYGVDNQIAFEGGYSMRINNPFDKKDSSALCLRSICIGTKLKQKYTFSAYMKSNQKGMKVSFNGQEIVLSDEWRRYSNSFINNGKSLYDDMINVHPLGKGTFWIDAAQLEEGDSATPYHRSFESSPLQVQEGKAEKVITEVPQFKPRRLNESAILDGRLEDPVWKKTEKLELVAINGQAAIEKTEARIWYNDDGIYIGVKCFDENAGKNKCKELKREGTVWNDPSIELFIDPKLTRNYYYQLAFNQKGVQFDAYCGDISWNGLWRTATYTDPKGKYWSAEVFLPFGEMGIDRGTGEWWGLNICRNNLNKKEYNCWSPTYGGYHTPERFGQIHINREVLDNYCFDCSQSEFRRVSEDKVLLSVKMVNNSGRKGEFLLDAELKSATDKEIVKFKQPVTFVGDESKSIVLGEITGAADEKYNLHIRLCSQDGKKVYYTGNKCLEMPNYFWMMPQYSLYTHEDEMLIKTKINLNEDNLHGAKLEFAICNSNGETVLKKVVTKLERETDVTLEIKDLAQGSYSLKASLENKQGRVLSCLNEKFRKFPPVPYEVKIDRISRMTVVDGKHFMPLGFAWEGELTPEVLEYLSKSGVNSIVYWPHLNYSKTQSVLDNAKKVEIKVQIGMNAKNKDQAIKFMEHFKKHPALLAWDIFDEAFTVQWGKENYQLISDRCIELKEIDPYHPIFINENQYGLSYLKNKKLDFPGEIVSIDYYAWTPSGNIPVTADYVRLMESMGRKKGKPNWIFLLGAGYAFWASRDYTPVEHEFSTYASVINGASGIYYFASHPKSESSWNRIKRIFKELNELTPVIASPLKSPPVKCAAPSIQLIVKTYGNATYIIAVNSSKESISARFDLSDLNSDGGKTSAKVLFEKRQAEIRNGIMEDTFAGYQRHVYVIEKTDSGKPVHF